MNRDSHGRDSYGRDSHGRDSHGRDSHGRDSHGSDSHGDSASPGFWVSITPELRAELHRLGRSSQYRRGDVLIVEGSDGKDVGVLMKGWVKALTRDVHGYESLLAARGPGDMVGEMAILGLTTRTAEVRAISQAEVLWVGGPDFVRLLGQSTELARVVLMVVVGKLRHADLWRARSGSLEVTQRLAELLLELMAQDDLGAGPTGGMSIPLSQEELAGFIGTSRRSVARALMTFRTKGWVQTSHCAISILQPRALRAVASKRAGTAEQEG